MGTYAASKAAVQVYARTWANELRGRGIRVNTITPGPTDTAMFDDVFGERADEVRTAIGSRLVVGRLGDPDELARPP